MKHIEKGIYEAKIPQVVPQRQDSRTIRVPIPKPTVEARHELYATFHKKAEEVRTQIRHAQSEGMKKGKWAKYTVEADEVRALNCQMYTQSDTQLADVRPSVCLCAVRGKFCSERTQATSSTFLSDLECY